jgi:hypothetical protein
VASNFSSIGFGIGSQKELHVVVRKLMPAAKAAPTYVGGAYLHYRSPEGCELWAQFSPDRELIGCNPHFAGDTRFRVRVTAAQDHGATPLDGQLVGELVEDQPGVPIVINVPDYRQYAARLQPPVDAVVQVAAIAQKLDIFASEDELARSPVKGLRADGAMIPSGTFSPDGTQRNPPLPLAILAGRVLQSEHRINSAGKLPFYVIQVKTLGGTLDVVSDIEYISRNPLPGHIIVGSFFLSGRVVAPLPSPPEQSQAASRVEN